MKRNLEIRDDLNQYIANTQQIPYIPIAFDRGKGSILYDSEGKRYIDFLSSACTANLGHGNEEIARAVYDQMNRLTQYTMSYFDTEAPIELAKRLTQMSPGNYEKKVLFSTTGSASIDAAIKLARGFTGRSKIISMIGAYHGSTYGAISASAISLNMSKKIGPLLPDIYHFKYPDKDNNWEKCIDDIREAFNMYLSPDEVAAIIIEPIAGDMGMIVPPVEWVWGLRKICDKYGILLVSDEVQLGLARTGTFYALEHFGVDADLYVLGKSLGGGLPLGCVIGKKEIMDSLDAPAHAFTLAGNSTVATSALKYLEIIEKIDAFSLAKEKGNYLKDKFQQLRDKYGFIGEIRGFGLSIGVDIINPKTGEKDPVATAKICYKCLERGLVLVFLNRSTLRVQPPLIIKYDEIDEAMKILDGVLSDLSDGKIDDSVVSSIKGW